MSKKNYTLMETELLEENRKLRSDIEELTRRCALYEQIANAARDEFQEQYWKHQELQNKLEALEARLSPKGGTLE